MTLLAKTEVYETRIKTCADCEFSTMFGPIKQCSICKCAITMKAGFEGSECPKNKWQ